MKILQDQLREKLETIKHGGEKQQIMAQLQLEEQFILEIIRFVMKKLKELTKKATFKTTVIRHWLETF